jgi:hypothetical protein
MKEQLRLSIEQCIRDHLEQDADRDAAIRAASVEIVEGLLRPLTTAHVDKWQPCPVLGPNGEVCMGRGKGHTSPHTWEECDDVGPNGCPCYEVEPIGQPGYPRPSRRGHAGPHSWER